MNYNDIFDYNNGNLVWKRKKELTKWDRAWNTRNAGKVAGTKGSNGYIRVSVDGKIRYAHRVIWEMLIGKIPEKYEIDHENHIRSDNRIENLKCVHPRDNDKNLSLSKNSKTGLTGVCFDTKRNKYRAHITINGKHINIGRFGTKSEAEKAREEYNLMYNFHKNHGK